jgi:DDE superfamily endonuclease
VLLCEQQTISAVRRLLAAEHGAPATVSNSTVSRAVKPTMDRSKPVMQPQITLRSMQRRLAFAKQHLRPERDWTGVAAGDSTYFTMNGQTPGGKYWHMKGQKPIKFRPNKSNQLHAYAIISVHGKTELHFVSGTTGLKQKYKRKTTKKGQSELLTGVGSEEVQDLMGQKLVPETRQLFAAAGAGEPTFLLDNAPAHVSKSTKKFFADNDIKVLQNWPANSPDLNPIENVWGIIKPQVYRQQYTTLAELKAAVLRAWAQLPQSTLRNLMLSMPRRLRRVVRQQGGYIGY